jgi:hypothetical protein
MPQRFVPCSDDLMSRYRIRTALAATALLLLAIGCGRERWTSTIATTLSGTATEATPMPTAKPRPKANARSRPARQPVQAATVPATPRAVQPIPSTGLPGGPDGSDDDLSDSGVRGRVMAGDRPVADAVVFVKGEGYQSNTTSGPGGRFLVGAPAGSYVVGARANNGIVRCDDRTVRVDETRFVTIAISCS